MKKIVWTFGLIAGVIMSVLMVVNVRFAERIGFDLATITGYTAIVAAFLLVFFGVRSYRDKQAGRAVSFGRAFLIGMLINVVASAFYVATWQAVRSRIAPDFIEKYSAYMLEKERAKGATPQELEAKRAQIQKNMELYKNPLINVAFTFLEPFPVGVVVALVSAGILRKRRDDIAPDIGAEAGSALGALV
jgi:hypothetical protein